MRVALVLLALAAVLHLARRGPMDWSGPTAGAHRGCLQSVLRKGKPTVILETRSPEYAGMFTNVATDRESRMLLRVLQWNGRWSEDFLQAGEQILVGPDASDAPVRAVYAMELGSRRGLVAWQPVRD